MKFLVLALPLLVVLAACRDGDPDDTPPVGRIAAAVDIAPATIAATAAAPGTDVRPRARRIGTSPATQRGAERVRRLADARRQLDAAWAACGRAADGDAARCRDEAVFAYDAATRDVRDEHRAAAAAGDAMPSGVLAGHDDLAVVQVTGTRG